MMANMKRRTLIQLNQQTYDALRRRAFARKQSISAVAREALATALGVDQPKKTYSVKDFSFIGAGRGPKTKRPISEDHDREFADIVQKRIRRKR